MNLENVNEAFPDSGAKTYDTACRTRRLGFTPKLIAPSLNIVHPIEHHNAVLGESALRPRISYPARFLLGAGMVVYDSWV